MCGICGIVDFRGEPIEAELVDRMRDIMRNRGPDDAGTKILPLVGLGHRRLSIIDLSERGHQPMCNEDGTVWLVFNGEIYNFAELRPELEAARHHFSSDTDSEVLIHGYETWGIQGLLERINGMFAFAIWDAKRRQLVLARDRLGKKPLYYGWHGGRLLFASDVKALWTAARGDWRVRLDSVARFLYWHYFPGREAVYENMYQLLPGHYMTVDENGADERRYWQLSFAPKLQGSFTDMLEGTAEVLRRAVARRLRSDVPLGAFLSGGVDSSLIVSWMGSGGNGPVRTFSMGTESPEHDERAAARIVARHLGTAHTEFQVSADAWSLLPRLVWEFGQPFGDAAAVPTYYVARCAREHVTVALTGDGGDESFGGYSQHHGRYLGAMVGRCVPGWLLDAGMGVASRRMYTGRRSLVDSAARFLRYAHPDPLVSWGAVDAWALHHLEPLWLPRHRPLLARESLIGYGMEAVKGFDGTDALDRALHFDLQVLLPFGYNVKVDVATMMCSLEARSPFQDREVVEWAARLSPSLKLRTREKKVLLKRIAAQRVPREVVYRRKHGFSVPVDGWFRGPWAKAARDIILGPSARARDLFDHQYLERLWEEHASGRARHGSRFLLLLWLELWFRMFVDGTMTPDEPMPTA